MAIPWQDPIREGGTLRVYAADSVARGPWRTVVTEAMREFNRLSGAHALGVRLERAASADDAHVEVETANGTIQRTVAGAEIRRSFSGQGLHGYTALAHRGGAVERAVVFLPSMPQTNTPRGQRNVGDPVKLVIAVHEFVHACGLTNDDHATNDLFAGYPSVDAGSRPADDKVQTSHAVRMPPLVLSAPTIEKIRQVWG